MSDYLCRDCEWVNHFLRDIRQTDILIIMSETLILRHVAENSNTRIVRIWEVLGTNTVRQIDHEIGYNFATEQWEVFQAHTQIYDIDDDGCLVGDGSNWSGDGKPWQEHAQERHKVLLGKRFPHECGEKEHTPSVKDVTAELIEANY